MFDIEDEQLDNKDDNGFRQAGPYLGLSWQMVITILLGIFIGYYIDDKFGTKPLYSIIFSVLFVIIALINFVRTVIRLGKEQDERDNLK